MAGDLALLFKIKADAAEAKAATAETRAAIQQLRASLGSDFNQMQSAAKTALSDIGNNLNAFVGTRIPLVGGAFVRLTGNLQGLHNEMKKGGPETANLVKQIDALAEKTGKSSSEVIKFLTSFVRLEGQTARDTAAIKTFGAAAAQDLIPQLEKAGTELASVATSSEAAGASFAAIAGPIGLAALAIAAMGAAAVIAAKELFDLTKATAEWEGKLLDLSQQTGLSVETLNALEIVLSKTGGDLSTAAASAGIFQKNLEEAQDSGSKAAKTFKQLGVETFNTEDALRQTLLALSKLPEGYHQTALALELFGRGGKSLLAVLKESNGDIDAAAAKLGELGRVSTEQARLADEFNDSLTDLQREMRGITAIVGRELIPVLLSALKELHQTLKDNKLLFHDLGVAAKLFAHIVDGDLKIALFVLNASLTLLQANLKAVTPYIELIQSLIDLIKESNSESFNRAIPAVKIPTPLEVGGTATATLPPAKKTAEQLDAEREEKRRLEFIESLNVALKKVRDELKGTDTATRAYAISQEELNGILKNASPELRKMAEAIAGNIDRFTKQLELQTRLREFLKQQEEQVRLAREGEKGQITQALDFIKSLEKEGAVLQETTKQWIIFNAALIKVAEDGKHVNDGIDLAIDAVDKLFEEFRNLSTGAGGVGIDLSDILTLPDAKSNKTIDVFQRIGAELSNILDLGKEGEQVIGGMLSSAFGSLANAVGNAVQAFVLFGNAGGGVRKFTATVIAEIAKMAAIQAIWELAQGLAMLALNFFWPDPKLTASAAAHFHAAAVYGGLAGIAAGAGRAVAGGAFNESGGATTGVSAGPRTTGGPTTQLEPVIANRNVAQPKIDLHVHVTRDEGSSVRAFIKDWRDNGAVRKLVQEDH